MLFSHLVETRIVEHVFTPALEHRSITGNITVSSQHLETIASEGNIAPEQERLVPQYQLVILTIT